MLNTAFAVVLLLFKAHLTLIHGFLLLIILTSEDIIKIEKNPNSYVESLFKFLNLLF